jgi:hypothetical protein
MPKNTLIQIRNTALNVPLFESRHNRLVLAVFFNSFCNPFRIVVPNYKYLLNSTEKIASAVERTVLRDRTDRIVLHFCFTQ